MKVLSIGRDAGCSICYDNPMISRRHALLKVYQSGKIELISLGKNGTFVNGILCKQNVPYPIKRKDVVSFAHACELDWSKVPNPLGWIKYAIIAFISVILLITVCVVGMNVYQLYDTPIESTEEGGSRPVETPNVDKKEPADDKNKDKENSSDKTTKKNKSKKD